MSNNFGIPEKMFEVEIYRCNLITGVVVAKATIHVCADRSNEAFGKAMVYCAGWTKESTHEIWFPKAVKLAD